MKWTFGILAVLSTAINAAPTSRQGPETSTSTDMNQEGNSKPIPIETTTQNLFGDIVSITPPNAESIELQRLNDDTRFYPDYRDKDPIDKEHFTEGPKIRAKRQDDYNDFNYEMYLDSIYPRKRRDSEDAEPLRIDLDIPGDSDSLSSDIASDFPATQSSVSDPDSVSTQVTYVIVSEDDTSSDEAVQTVMEHLNTDRGVHTTEVIDLAIPSSKQEATNSDSSSTDSFSERSRVLQAIAKTIRTKRSLSESKRSSSIETNQSSSSGTQQKARKKRQIPYYRLPDFLNYRVGRSASESDSDDTEPDDSPGLNMKDLSMDGTDLKLIDSVAPLPEYSYAFSELTRPSSTYVDGHLRNYYVAERRKTKRSLPSEYSTERSHPESTTEPDIKVTTELDLKVTTEPDVDVVTATYPLGIDATKNNLSLPEGNFLGPRIYAKGDLLQEEEPAVTGIAAPMEKVESIPVLNGSETDIVYSAPVNNLNLPLLIPVVGPTSHPGEEPRIELSIPSGYVPYIIQLTPTSKTTTKETETVEKSDNRDILRSTPMGEASSEIKSTSMVPKPEDPTNLSSLPTIIVTPSNPTMSVQGVSNKSKLLSESEAVTKAPHSQDVGSPETFTTTDSLGLPTSSPEDESRAASKKKRANWKSISSAPVEEKEQPKQQTAKWESASNAPTSGIQTNQPSSGWKSVSEGEEELPGQQTSSWESISSAPVGELQESPEEQTASWESADTVPTVNDELQNQTAKWESVSSAPTGEEELSNQRKTSWKSIPVGGEELPRQKTARWDPVLNSVTGEPESSTHQTDAPAGSPVTVSRNIQQSASSIVASVPQPKSSDVSSTLASAQMNDSPAMSQLTLPRQKLQSRRKNEIIPILEKNSVMSPNGSFSFSYKSGNGIQVEESGYLKKEHVPEGSIGSGVGPAVQGSYSYPSPDGRVISVRYVADENGFRPEVEDLPEQLK